MKVFISWSGQRSKVVAELISDWLKCVIQASQPWISTRDIDRGAIWFSEINDKLKDVSVGVVCLTQENKGKPWILFETGALAKGLSTNRVCTFLIDLNPEDLQDPLAQFNHTTPNVQSVWELVRTINACLNDKALDERILKQVFDTYWPQFETNFQSALKHNPPEEDTPPRTEQDILSEILSNTRALSNRIRKIENSIYKSTKTNYNNSTTTLKDISELQKDVLNIILAGVNDEDEIISFLNSHDVPDTIVRQTIRDTLKNRKSTIIDVNNG
ncbi:MULTISPECIES: TIR domain-containing protein [Klebsiella pneumoniae complex]|uniref:TIR domain-containing protein n=1 Tax=Klebsiella pneumoniae complex TaxID=3390273 RepID=UPI00092F8427|nr:MULTISPECIES: TIR domain-containing protein [Klebsiella]EIV7249516.1 toll/interleukin-1 receptor domain-containing protein [Klebsiella variicola]MBC4316421.1 toll/interleukin-1 receptor domain-containing protein [Klebsiella quasipneumoniae]MBL4397470.1 toll/interleukin-1 receptor domain-containing protein [Klebsiella pneumoniae]MCS6675613.1 toll/interleukin-1 receptor domain-containing protein [Klebsiella pneumoniae subsp. pneumoniae]MDW7487143.1 TIR domain-containing protein [Klebsiella pn